MKVKPPLEKHEQSAGIALLRQLGAAVYSSGTVRPRGSLDYSTRQTPGIPDVEAFLPAMNGRPATLLKWEVKRQRWTASAWRAEQREYASRCDAVGLPYVIGSVDDLLTWLQDAGYVTAWQLPHYRARK